MFNKEQKQNQEKAGGKMKADQKIVSRIAYVC